jgi:hypothetical protein
MSVGICDIPQAGGDLIGGWHDHISNKRLTSPREVNDADRHNPRPV